MPWQKNVQKLLDADYAIATTGNAGPTKGDSDARWAQFLLQLVLRHVLLRKNLPLVKIGNVL